MTDFKSLWSLEKSLRSIADRKGSKVAEDIAAQVAPVISKISQETFAARTNPYGVPWAPAVDGSEVTLDKTGALKAAIQYKSFGQKLRCVLGPKYAKYQVGKRHVFPPRGGLLPPAYQQKIHKIAIETIKLWSGLR